ncbi:hypothetical protein BVG16_06795 [Paenibacillus selenitireducens]|uniref:Uncharacterized protein n=1 Tax=Paenibacillus selenitireducens TaxID=1324314 RepID=A0A1T2XKS8_9BACL|nr:hypothetical protein [Paenibacillus selenitireducens]OPA80432.1 hypothetical protein BVG16_06795 [Paenibacillus selenitireducens]
MEMGMIVQLIEKQSDGNLVQIDERRWSREMVEALHHVNYVTISGREFETIEGRLNVEKQTMELLLIAVRNRSLT